MILIADSGSTKCDWLLVDKEGVILAKQVTPGVNPVMFSLEELLQRLKLASDILIYADQIKEVFFYGAGCGLEENQRLIYNALKQLYLKAEIEVQSDLVAAVRATVDGPSIICIVGTGSNSCYYDGENIHFGFDSLGYTIMDEASGNYFGKQLLRDYFYKKMPSEIAESFALEYMLDTQKVLQHLYKEPMPAKYLASFAKFLFKEVEDSSYFNDLLEKGFKDLITYQIKLWPNYKQLPVHFIGSIAYYGKDILNQTLTQERIKLGIVIQAPIEKLFEYHTK